MEVVGFTEDVLLAAVGHLVYHKAQGILFLVMVAPHKILWLMHHLAKHYYNL
jgi:hypothetical protein